MSASGVLPPCMEYAQHFYHALADLVDHQIVGADHHFAGAGHPARPEQKWHARQAFHRLQNVIEKLTGSDWIAFVDITDDLGEITSGFMYPLNAQNALSFADPALRAPTLPLHRAEREAFCYRWLPELWRGTSGRNPSPLGQCRIRKSEDQGLVSYGQNITHLVWLTLRVRGCYGGECTNR